MIIKTKIFKINGQFDKYATEGTVRYQNWSDLAKELGKDWDNMTKRQKTNFRYRHPGQLKPIPTNVEIYEVKANVPPLFGESQLIDAAIHALIFKRKTLFLECKNGISGWETADFTITKIK